VADIREALADWREAPPQRVRALLRRFLTAVVVEKGTLRIQYVMPHTFDRDMFGSPLVAQIISLPVIWRPALNSRSGQTSSR
jgi:hypothetical protein